MDATLWGDALPDELEPGTWDLDPDMQHTFARIFFGAMSSAGESVAVADDPELEARRVEAAIGFMVAGFQVLVEQGVELPNALADDATE